MPLPDTSPRVWLAVAAGALAGLGLGAPAADAAPSATLSVLSPADDSLATGAVDVKVRVPANATRVQARVAGRNVMLRGTGAVRTASVPVAKLTPGRTLVTVRARVKGKNQFDHARIVVGTPKPSLLAAAPVVAEQRGTAALALNLRTRPSLLRVTVNGKRAPQLRLPDAGKVRLPLAADDGLRFGANTVRVRAYDARTGRWARTTTRFQMSRRAPLASAGRDVRVTAGTAIKLSGAGSVARRDQLPLGYHWVIASKPRGAKAALRNANTKRPSLVTTNPGRYRVRLELREGGRFAHAAAVAPVAQDVVSVDAAASIQPWGTPITTLVPNGDGTSRTTIQGVPINADGKSDYIDTPNNMVQLTVLDRATLGLDSSTQLSPSNPGAITAAANALNSSQLGILTGAPGCCSWTSTTGPISNPSAGFSIVFVGGSYTNPIIANNGSPAVAWNSPQTNGAISGVIRKSHSMVTGGGDAYTYASTDGVRFDTYHDNGDGSFTMNLGPQTNTFSGTGIAGMALAPDLKTVIWAEWFPLTGDPATDQNTLGGLESQLLWLAGAAQNGAVVALQTHGKPKATTTAWGEVGNALTPLGGTSSVWDELDGTGDYALVSRSGSGASSALHEIASAEASGPLTNANTASPFKATNGTLRGVLTRGADALPIIAGATSLPTTAATDANGNTVQVNPMEMSALANATPQPWPLTSAGQIKAYQYISQQLALGAPGVSGPGLCYTPTTWDLRAEYCNADDRDDWNASDGFSGQLAKLTAPANPSGFTAADFTAVQNQLQSEFAKIANVFNVFDELRAPIFNSAAQTNKDVVSATTNVENSLSHKSDNAAVGLQPWFTDILQPLQDIDDTDVSMGLGLFASAADLALGAVADDNGNPALDSFEANTDGIGNEAVTRLTGAATQLALIEQMVLTDWTKLSTTAAYSQNVWSANDWSSDANLPVVQAGTRAWLYTTMVPMAYTQIYVTPGAANGGNTVAGLNAIQCQYNDEDQFLWRWPFRDGAVMDGNGNPIGPSLQASAAFAPLTATNADGSAVSPFVWGLGNPTGKMDLETPSASLTDPLFKPTSWTDSSGNPGVGLYPEQFYSWGWVNAPNRISWAAAKKKLANPKSCSA